ncbi:putative signal transduction protein containing sensor and EAL domain containing protein [Bradyrhizobium sp. YR681]|uniref:EAL domain-containing protein n=1 Tax=Bradyrhizobium sp. YR681 TaxID=1144344 RepID=UPI00026F97E9|nr:EAL domain-containing protein [Bradyrhizobium sp. YR681]EJN09153.1 putative signal transduction protein containing sensor and EAL domain containing protein [Bradyrhizobium sp. YR681]
MASARSKFTLVALVLASMAAFTLAGHVAVTRFIHDQQAHQLDELTDVVLRRSEFAVDFAAASLDELAGRGLATCDAASLQAIRLHVYQRSAVKDVRLVNSDGSVICSAYSETLEFDRGWADRGDMLASRDSGLMLFRVEQFGGDALGVLRDIGNNKALVAILGVNANLFDIMPAELRAHGEVLLALNNGAQLGEFMLDANKALPHPVEFARSSARYPLRTVIRIDRTVLSTWNTEAYWPAMAVAIALGLLFGVLLSRTRRMEGPVADLDRGLARGEFRPYFQPIFDLRTGRIKGCEILARWLREDGSIVPPMNFIPLAESSGRIEAMTWQILGRALTDLQPHLKADKEFKLSFNVVPKHLLSEGFVGALRSAVAAMKVSARQIVVEVTERDELDDLARAAAVVRELRDYGFRVAIDDVGVGHSGLSRLKGLGANTIKIDKFFVDTITVDASTTTIVEMLVALARDFHMTVVAEGIETEEQASALISCGVEEGQGYLVAAPLPLKKFCELVESRHMTSAAATPDGTVALVA